MTEWQDDRGRRRTMRTDAWSGEGEAYQAWLRSGPRRTPLPRRRRLGRLLLPALAIAAAVALVWLFVAERLGTALRGLG